MTFSAVVTASPAAAAADACSARNPFAAGLATELAQRYPGRRFSAAVYEPTGCVYTLHPDLRMTTASVVKLEVMAAVLLRAQREGRGLTSWERERIEPMITESANRPTTELLQSLGGPAAMERVDADFALRHTVHESPYWGLTTTSATDQVHLLRQVVAGELGPLTSAYRAEARRYLTSVVPSQRWGLSARVPAGWTVAQKNGFAGSQCCRWRLNSVGWVERPDRTGWAVAVLSDGWAGEREGIAAVDELTGRLNAAMTDSPLSAPAAGFTAAGRQDVFARGADGALWRRTWAGSSGFGPWRRIGGVLSSSPDAAPRPGGGVDAVVRGGDFAAWRFRWSGSRWVQERLGGECASAPAAAWSSSSHLDVACRGVDNRLWLRTSGTGWTAVGGGRITSDPDVAAGGGPTPSLVARDTDRAVRLWTWDGTGWRSNGLGGACRSAPTAVWSSSTRFDVACRGDDDALWYRTRQSGSWEPWRSAGGALLSDPDGVAPGGGQPPQFLGRGADGGIWSYYSTGGHGWDVVRWGRP
jgi:beta-lactamase class A